jgi:hypothetical protein
MCLPKRPKIKASPPPAPTPTPEAPAPSPNMGITQDPASGNTIQQSMTLSGGLGTIESISSFNKYTEAPALDSPFGMESQRVKREKARLSIAP